MSAIEPEHQQPDVNLDLGFGSVVSRESRARLLNRDGTFNVVRAGLGWVEIVAPQTLLRLSWARFIALVSGLYVAINVVFALAFVACGPNAIGSGLAMLGGRFTQAFFFSIQTFAT